MIVSTKQIVGLAILAAVVAAVFSSCREYAEDTLTPKAIVKEHFGKTSEGQQIFLYTLCNKDGLVAKLTNYGALLTELHVPDRKGESADIVLGFDNLESYLAGHPYFGCTIGRVAHQLKNGRFTLDGKQYTLPTNFGLNHLHGGPKGFDKHVWKGTEVESAAGPAVKFTYLSRDGEQGYPGNLHSAVTYTLTHKDELRIDYQAKTDQATPVNLTNHSYFNLSGTRSETILAHELMVTADHYLPLDETFAPTGEIRSLKGTVLDFRKPVAIGTRIDQLKGAPGGYDLNYVLRNQEGSLALAARVRDPESGRVMEIYTTQPGIQFYTANFLDGTITGKSDKVYTKHSGLCLETQHYPDSVNHPNFPSVILRPGETYAQTTVHKFHTQD